MRGLFVTATDTGVGKSVLSAALLAAMRAAGLSVSAYKPALTGTEELPNGAWPPDDELLALASGATPAEVAPLRFAPAVSPHLAAELAHAPIDPRALIEGAHRRDPGEEGVLLVEGVGGLLVPLAEDYLLRDLARDLGLPLLLAVRPGLGTINHTLLTLEGARAAALDVRAVVITPWPQAPGEIERSNRETISRLGGLPVATLAHISAPTPALLAAAGETLPWRGWLAAPSTVPGR